MEMDSPAIVAHSEEEDGGECAVPADKLKGSNQ
jgi:hypothetical protein